MAYADEGMLASLNIKSQASKIAIGSDGTIIHRAGVGDSRLRELDSALRRHRRQLAYADLRAASPVPGRLAESLRRYRSSVPIGRFIAMVGFLVWRRSDGRYLLLRRSPDKDFAAGEWETGSGRLDQGEGFADAVIRESMEELGTEVRIECILGTTHFYQRRADPGQRHGWRQLRVLHPGRVRFVPQR